MLLYINRCLNRHRVLIFLFLSFLHYSFYPTNHYNKTEELKSSKGNNTDLTSICESPEQPFNTNFSKTNKKCLNNSSESTKLTALKYLSFNNDHSNCKSIHSDFSNRKSRIVLPEVTPSLSSPRSPPENII